MKKYTSPELEMLSLEIEDVITASAAAPSSSSSAIVPPASSSVAPTVSDAGLDNTVSADTWKQ
ncbi:MAG: hypothetical protein E7646_04350 [Ruminococcaceae bacterium]|nr:hypothetical protein [Oscillospiraceae bacterium]